MTKLKQLKWYLKQLLPFKYRSKFIDQDGQYIEMTFRMWFGRCYNIVNNIH